VDKGRSSPNPIALPAQFGQFRLEAPALFGLWQIGKFGGEGGRGVHAPQRALEVASDLGQLAGNVTVELALIHLVEHMQQRTARLCAGQLTFPRGTFVSLLCAFDAVLIFLAIVR
jgi:hypothetical protein